MATDGRKFGAEWREALPALKSALDACFKRAGEYNDPDYLLRRLRSGAVGVDLVAYTYALIAACEWEICGEMVPDARSHKRTQAPTLMHARDKAIADARSEVLEDVMRHLRTALTVEAGIDAPEGATFYEVVELIAGALRANTATEEELRATIANARADALADAVKYLRRSLAHIADGVPMPDAVTLHDVVQAIAQRLQRGGVQT